MPQTKYIAETSCKEEKHSSLLNQNIIDNEKNQHLKIYPQNTCVKDFTVKKHSSLLAQSINNNLKINILKIYHKQDT